MNNFKAQDSDRLPLERSAQARMQDGTLSSPEPLSHYRNVPAWVLIADPGAGKTDTFESLKQTEGGYYTKASDFVELDLLPDWAPPIFIDGLDEMNAGSAAGSTPLGQIRTKLQQLGTPQFRISCREADWRGNTDSAALQRLVGDNNFLELHLAPLTRDQTRTLIAHWLQSSDEDAEKFMHDAERRDLSGLLDNPQTLRMLVKAVANKEDGWPDSKTTTYEMACAQLVREHNGEHLANTSHNTLSDNQVLLAAGYLCAVMLLSGSGAITLQRHREPRTGVMPLPELVNAASAPDLPACRTALHTRLFRGNGHGDFWPVHRTIAEYLGAHYLAQRIHDGLPASRVLALMLGEDAGIVPELRGLHAWLAATALGDLRRELIERDPLGVVLNGDVRGFTHEEKLRVLQALRDEAMRYTYFRSQNWVSHPFGALATPDMEGQFGALLASADRNPAHLALLDCVLDALAHGQSMPALALVLEHVVRDKTYWPSLRTTALGVLVVYAREGQAYSRLTQLLVDVHDNVVEDLEDELLGTLLDALYPSHISPTEIWRYFRHPKAENFLGTYRIFWDGFSKQPTTRCEVATSLDALVAVNYQLKDEYDRFGEAEIVGGLLVQGVLQHGEKIDAARLYRWLGLGLSEYFDNRLQPEHGVVIGQWIQEHPASYKALFEYGLGTLTQENTNSGLGWWRINAMFLGASEPADAKFWYLSLAEKTTNDDWRHQLIFNAIRVAEHVDGEEAGTALLKNWVTLYPDDVKWVNQVLEHRRAPPEPYPRYQAELSAVNEKLAQRQRERTKFFQEHLSSFDPGPAHLGALVEVANVYLNITPNSKEPEPRARLLALLNHNHEWLHLALHGLRQCLFRDDLPTTEDIIKLHLESRRYHLALPCLAAMELRYSEDAGTAFDLPSKILETVISFELTTLSDQTSVWFKQLLAQSPAVVAGVMQRLISLKISAKTEYISRMPALTGDASYAAVAKLMTKSLLENFPIKASENQLKHLRLLILSMSTHLDPETQRSLIANKLSAKGMDVTQQAYWLTVGVLLAPELYLERIQQFVQKTQARTNHVFALIHERRDRGGLQVALPVTTQTFLISLLGPRSNPSWTSESSWVTTEMEMGRYVADLISALAGNPDDSAMQALTDLQQRHDMKHWAESINRALYDQRITRRKARFKPAAVADVCTTLANLQPASAADLWALTVDHFKQLIAEIRHGSTNDYRQYWAGDTPKVENDCRDALMSDLRQRLLLVGISAEREGSYADDKRADIKVISGGFHIPVEIKRESHPDVWKAIGNQLSAKYGRESASDGYGIYLVFWFTGDLKAAPTDGGARVKSPQELQQRLIATVPEALKHKIAVLVVDCSKPSVTQPTKKISL